MTHELLRDLASTETVELLGHVNRGTFADDEDLAKEFVELGVDDGRIDRQETRGNLGG